MQLAEENRTGSMANLTPDTYRSENSRVLLFVVAVVGAIAVVAVIVAAVSMSRPTIPNVTVTSGQGSSAKCPTTAVISTNPQSSAGLAQKVWTIMIGHDYGAHEYIDGTGYINGFSLQVIKAVCQAAGIQCVAIWDKYKNCWGSEPAEHAYGGQGLMSRWYDGCNGWYTTVERVHVFSFSQPYLKPPKAYFFIRKGETFNAKDLTGKKIGFIAGWASDEKCLARQTGITANVLQKGSIVYQTDSKTLVTALKNSQIDAIFTTKETMDSYVTSGDVDQVGASGSGFSCFIAGNAMMTRKDSAFNALWNQGFSRLRANGDFKKLCDEGRTKHGVKGTIDCID